jgi:hypothetical protein
VFGLEVRSQIELPFLAGADSSPSTGRALTLTGGSNGVEQLPWRGSLDPLCDQRDADGNVVLRIEMHPEDGYLLHGAEHGSYLLAPDGGRLRCDPEGSAPESWQRLLIAQALPFAAVLQGLETLHASAVERDGEAVAVLGASGAGKTSVALELCRLGADFLADDVLALEASGGRLLAHPGTPLAGLDHREAERLESLGLSRQQEVVASNARERLLRIERTGASAPLAALFLLDRRANGPKTPQLQRLASPRSLLAASFNFVLDGPERLRRMLDVCALAARCRVERLSAGPGADATQLALAIEQRLAR